MRKKHKDVLLSVPLDKWYLFGKEPTEHSPSTWHAKLQVSRHHCILISLEGSKRVGYSTLIKRLGRDDNDERLVRLNRQKWSRHNKDISLLLKTIVTIKKNKELKRETALLKRFIKDQL